MSKIIGIDLGTTNSCVSVISGNNPVVIPSLQGSRITPSVVAVTNSGDIIVGEIAKRQAATNPKNTVFSVKRNMGTDKKYILNNTEYLPQDISSEILKYLKKSAEEYLGEPVTDAIVTVPAYFTDSQRQATKLAGINAGLNVQRIINEPTTAAVAYGLNESESGIIAVYDLGGGTFDISILKLTDGLFEVIATNGNNKLGGDDFDLLLAKYVNKVFQEETGVDLFADIMSSVRLMEACEKAKIELSVSKTAIINVPYITVTSTGPLHLNMEITRDKFEELITPLIKETINLLKLTTEESGLEFNEIDKILLIGGSTRIPMISKEIDNLTGITPSKNVNPDECVAMGASIQGAIINGEIKDLLLLDVTPLSLGVEVHGGLFSKIIDKNTTIPYRGYKRFSTAVDNQKEVEIKVYQGEREFAKDNKLLGNFILNNISQAPKGVPQIDVIFDIDINGIVNISAVDVQTGNSESIVLENQQNISEDEVKKALEEAAINAKKDRLFKEQIETINKANSTIEYANRVLSEYKDDIEENLNERVRTTIKELTLNITDGNVLLIETNTKELNDTISGFLISKQNPEAS